MRTINYESDFKLVERRSDEISLSDSPFRFTYYVKMNKWSYVAEYDGQNYVNCMPTGDGGVIVAIDSPKFGIGVLSVRREFYLDDLDFKDGVYNLISVESTGILLDKGITDDSAEINVEVLPFFAKAMENVEHIKKVINYESDFKIVEGFKSDISILAAPFKFTYYTNPRRGSVIASYDGKEFCHCYPTDDDRVVIPFDNHGLGIGSLMVKREFYLDDKDYADKKCHLVTIESTGITLDSGATDFAGAVNIEHSPYYHQLGGGKGEKGEDGKSAYEIWLEQGNSGSEQDFLDSLKGDKGEKGDKMTYDDLSEEDKNNLASRVEVPAPEVDLSEYVTKDEVATAIQSAITNALNTEV